MEDARGKEGERLLPTSSLEGPRRSCRLWGGTKVGGRDPRTGPALPCGLLSCPEIGAGTSDPPSHPVTVKGLLAQGRLSRSRPPQPSCGVRQGRFPALTRSTLEASLPLGGVGVQGGVCPGRWPPRSGGGAVSNLNPPLSLWANLRHPADGVISAPPWCAVPVPDEHVLLREVTCEGRRCSRMRSRSRTAAGPPPVAPGGCGGRATSCPQPTLDACHCRPCVWSFVVPSPQGTHLVHSIGH